MCLLRASAPDKQSKAEFVVTVAGRVKGGFVWSPDNILWFKKNHP